MPKDINEKIAHNETTPITSIGFTSVKAFTKEAIDSLLLKMANNHFGDVLRFKGYTLIDSEWYLLNYVSKTIDYDKVTNKQEIDRLEESKGFLTVIGTGLIKLKLRQAFTEMTLRPSPKLKK